jgi:hypothetical protein
MRFRIASGDVVDQETAALETPFIGTADAHNGRPDHLAQKFFPAFGMKVG